jgi:HKD family nuclease
MEMITKLSEGLLPELKTANEVWIAVALLNSTGLKFINDNLQDNCIRHWLIGIDLPTDSKALMDLYKSNSVVRLYTKEYYHPKLYLFKTGNLYKAFVGSGNCTNGGLNTNIELTIAIENQEICKQLKSWFEELFKNGIQLREDFLQSYKNDERKKRHQEEERNVKQQKIQLNDEYNAILVERNKFINMLINYRKADNYNTVVLERSKKIKELRIALDYPNFSAENINIDTFFSIPELGKLRQVPKPTIKQEIKKFSKLLAMLCDEQIDIATRYNEALEGDLKIKGVKEALISKVLTTHEPSLYFVKNKKSIYTLKKYGFEPRGLSEGEEYKSICNFLKEICKEADIIDLAVLDNYLYEEANNPK